MNSLRDYFNKKGIVESVGYDIINILGLKNVANGEIIEICINVKGQKTQKALVLNLATVIFKHFNKIVKMEITWLPLALLNNHYWHKIKNIMLSNFLYLIQVGALGVIFSKNIIQSVLFLIVTFFLNSVLFIYSGADFIGLIILIVYIGAIMVLFLFVVIMRNKNFCIKNFCIGNNLYFYSILSKNY